MPLSTNDIIKLISDVSEEENIKVAMYESLKGGVIAGCATAIGGLIMGPIGLAAGGTVGGITSYYVCNKFESVPSIITKMDPSKREILVNRIRIFLQKHGICGASCLGNVLSNQFLRLLLLQLLSATFWVVGKYVVSKLNSRKERNNQQSLYTGKEREELQSLYTQI